jgi:DNA-directed RNA polymerase subunit RPC12/RpoP
MDKLQENVAMANRSPDTANRLLTNLEKQEVLLYRMATATIVCPACGYDTSHDAAVEKFGEEYDLLNGNPDANCRCPHCETRLVYSILLMGGEQCFSIHPDDLKKPNVKPGTPTQSFYCTRGRGRSRG